MLHHSALSFNYRQVVHAALSNDPEVSRGWDDFFLVRVCVFAFFSSPFLVTKKPCCFQGLCLVCDSLQVFAHICWDIRRYSDLPQIYLLFG